MASSENEYPYAPDQFDHEADRVGAHGAHREDDPLWKQNLPYVLIALAAVLALLAAIWLFSTIGNNQNEPAPKATESSAPASDDGAEGEASDEPTETETSLPEADKSHPVLVLNGSRTNGLAGNWKSALQDAGWEKVDTGTGKRSDHAAVYYKDEADLGTATELASYLGVEPEQSDDHPSSITVVVLEQPGDLANPEGAADGDQGESDDQG